MTPKASLPRRRSIRLHGHDYTQPGAYFVTFCTQGHRPLLGRVVQGEMESSPYGHIVEDEWRRTGKLRPYVHLDALAVMPNHVHAILWIVSPEVGPGETTENGPGIGTMDSSAGVAASHTGTAASSTGTAAAHTDTAGSRTGTARRARTEQFGKPVSGSLPTIVRAFKAAVTKRINESRGTPGAPVWQRNYYEHVIRDETDLARLRTYVAENPVHWAEDRFYC